MVVNATLNTMSVISSRSVLIVEETGKNHRPAAMICLNFHFIAYDDNIVMCVLDYDPCVPNPCTHGTCTTSTGSVQCSCHSGYSGTTCGKCICFEQQFYER
jgi:hypothetical protein